MEYKYNIGDILYDSFYECHYLIEKISTPPSMIPWKSVQYYYTRKLEDDRRDSFTSFSIDTSDKIYKVA